MVIPESTLDQIRSGVVSLAFRKWIRPTVRVGATLKTGVGTLEILEVERVDERDITPCDAAQAGYTSLGDLLEELEEGRPGWIHRIRLRHRSTGRADPKP